MTQGTITETDLIMMERCIELSKAARTYGEFPFAAIVCDEQGIVSEAINRVARDTDVTRHAELIALSEAQRVLHRPDLTGCTLYSSVEPCPMCSFPIRETRISRVVFAIRSPLMGGFSKFKVLQDMEMSNVMPEFFGDPPNIIGGVLVQKAENVWRNCNPIIWAVIRYRGCFGGDPDPNLCLHWQGPNRSHRFNWHQIAQRMIATASRLRGQPTEPRRLENQTTSPAADREFRPEPD